MEAESGLLGLLPGSDVDVVQDLQVVRQELHRDHQHVGCAGPTEAGEEVLEVGLQPLLRGVAGALVGEPPLPVAEGGARHHRVDRLHQLLQVLGLAVHHRLGQAVGGEDHRYEPAL